MVKIEVSAEVVKMIDRMMKMSDSSDRELTIRRAMIAYEDVLNGA